MEVNECKRTRADGVDGAETPLSLCPHMAAIDQDGGRINGSQPSGGIII